jgi:hypothetical protein
MKNITLNKKTFPTVELGEVSYTAPIFRDGGKIYCHSEVIDEESQGAYFFSDYYGEMNNNSLPWISDALSAWAKKHVSPNAFWEWENASLLVLNV